MLSSCKKHLQLITTSQMLVSEHYREWTDLRTYILSPPSQIKNQWRQRQDGKAEFYCSALELLGACSKSLGWPKGPVGGRGFSIREIRMLPPVYRLLCPEREGKRGIYPSPQLSSSVVFPPAPQRGPGGTVGEPKGGPFTRREADTPEGRLPLPEASWEHLC